MKKLLIVIMLVFMTSFLFAGQTLVATYDKLPPLLRGIWASAEKEDLDDTLFMSTGIVVGNQYGTLRITFVEKYETDKGLMFVINTEDKEIKFFIIFPMAAESPNLTILCIYKNDKLLFGKAITIKQ